MANLIPAQWEPARLNPAVRIWTVLLCSLFVLMPGGDLFGQHEDISPDQLKFFESKIRPVLVRECYSCHSEQTGQAKGGLRLDSKIRMEVGGSSGPAVVAGNLEESMLWNAINYQDYRMPPRKQLTSRQIADFREWIEMGAPDPRVSKVAKIRASVTASDIEQGRDFWSFTRPKKPIVPTIEEPDWARNEIDNYIADRLAKENLTTSTDADPFAFLRRLAFDLVGLPPTPAQVEFFQKRWQEDPDAAVSEMVDQFLSSQHYGERWARHWLDVARYAESTGREINATFPNAWRYRDYVIDSFNDDKPYDEFVQEQIAGDLLPAKDDEEWAEQLIATGFLAIGPKSLIERNVRQFNLDLVDEQIDVTTRVVLGVSVACARCHDHKFDPIQQQDYYAMAGIFESTSTHYGTLNAGRNRQPANELILPVSDPSPQDERLSLEMYAKLNNEKQRLRDELVVMKRKRAAAQKSRAKGKEDPAISIRSINRLTARIAVIDKKLNSVDKSGNPHSFCMGVQDRDQPKDAKLLARGEFDQPVGSVPRGFVQVLDRNRQGIHPKKSGRLELAKWMTSRKNPLAARVMVNRVWQQMFGTGIVTTPENFGASGTRPTHPELLDYLAIEFMKQDWSIKEVVRKIANSRTYRMSTTFDAGSYDVDPENMFYWRANPRQLDAEALRDSMLSVSGEIDFDRPRASMVSRAGSTVVRDGKVTAVNTNALLARESSDNMMEMSRRERRKIRSANRPKVYDVEKLEDFRSVYLPILRDNLPRALEVFDFAEPGLVVGKRESSNTPSQGLYLLNNNFVRRQSRKMAERLIAEADTTESRIRLAFQYAYGRPPTDAESSTAYEFYSNFDVSRRYRERESAVELKKLSALTQSILASAEFRYTN